MPFYQKELRFGPIDKALREQSLRGDKGPLESRKSELESFRCSYSIAFIPMQPNTYLLSIYRIPGLGMQQ